MFLKKTGGEWIPTCFFLQIEIKQSNHSLQSKSNFYTKYRQYLKQKTKNKKYLHCKFYGVYLGLHCKFYSELKINATAKGNSTMDLKERQKGIDRINQYLKEVTNDK